MAQKTASEELPIRLIDADSEKLVLGDIINRADRRIAELLEPDDFAIEAHRRVFRLIQQVVASGEAPGLSQCYRILLDTHKTPAELGLPLLSGLAFDGVPIANPDAWVKSLRRKAIERRAYRLGDKMQQTMAAGIDTAEEITGARDELRKLETAIEVQTAPRMTTIGDLIGQIDGGLDALLSIPRGVISSPWPTFNYQTNGGLKPGELWVIASRPSIGKSTAALQWAFHAAARDKRVLFCSLEMPVKELLRRLISFVGGINHGILMSGRLDEQGRYQVMKTVSQIQNLPLEITDQARTMRSVLARIANSKNGPYDAVFVDYLGLIEVGGRYETRNLEVSALSRRLKLAALEYEVPIVALHQLNRQSEIESRRPQLSDLRDSGSIEQDADVVLFLDSPSSRKKSDAPKNAVDLVVAKQRNGRRDFSVALTFDHALCRMTENTDQREG